jgi:hypothetical protein
MQRAARRHRQTLVERLADNIVPERQPVGLGGQDADGGRLLDHAEEI